MTGGRDAGGSAKSLRDNRGRTCIQIIFHQAKPHSML
jgi:hypothetical protein